jgi:hypothetical protein
MTIRGLMLKAIAVMREVKDRRAEKQRRMAYAEEQKRIHDFIREYARDPYQP